MPRSINPKNKQAVVVQPFAELHSEEVHEIINRPPSWLVRWGITLLFSLTVVLIGGCWLIKYPEIVSVPVILTSSVEPRGDHFQGLVKISQANLGKISVGQKVLVKLEAYPDSKYGMVEGILSHISLSSGKDGAYSGYISFPEKLKTRYGHVLIYRNGLRGQAEIITADKHLAERFF